MYCILKKAPIRFTCSFVRGSLNIFFQCTSHSCYSWRKASRMFNNGPKLLRSLTNYFKHSDGIVGHAVGLSLKLSSHFPMCFTTSFGNLLIGFTFMSSLLFYLYLWDDCYAHIHEVVGNHTSRPSYHPGTHGFQTLYHMVLCRTMHSLSCLMKAKAIGAHFFWGENVF